MNTHTKQSNNYLEAINLNSKEKVEIIKSAIERKSIPKSEDSFFRIVELGVGGGEPIKELTHLLEKNKDLKIIGVDTLSNIVDSLMVFPNVEGIVAHADNLPFKKDSISAINASAILHEISSYGTSDKKNIEYGLGAIRQAFKEFKRVLLPGGIVACRDVLAPAMDPLTLKIVKYYPYSWRMFAEFFITDFVKSQPAFYQKSKIEGRVFDNAYILEAPVGLHRELQRHYLMFRDYIRNIEAKEFGINIRKAYWLDQSKGLKFMTFSIKRKYCKKVNLEHFERKSIFRKIYKGTSDYVDQLYDELIEFKFNEMAKGTKDGVKFSGLIDLWKQREGHEHYIYGNFSDILSMLSELADDDYVLFPENAEDLSISPRDYYNAYLRRVVDLPEFDGKQIMTFKKMRTPEARESALRLKNSSLVNQAVLEKIIEKFS